MWGPLACIEIHQISIWLNTRARTTSHYHLRILWPHYMSLEVGWDNLNLFHFIMREDLHVYKSIELAFGWEPGHILHTSTWGSCDHTTTRVWRSTGTTLIYSILSCVKTRMYKNPSDQHLIKGTVTYDFTLSTEESVTTLLHEFGRCVWDGLRDTFSLGLSQFHGHGSRLVCEAALRTTSIFFCLFLFLFLPGG